VKHAQTRLRGVMDNVCDCAYCGSSLDAAERRRLARRKRKGVALRPVIFISGGGGGVRGAFLIGKSDYFISRQTTGGV